MVRGVRTTAAGLLCLVAMQGLVLAPRGAAAEEETVLAESDFLWDVDGWTTRGEAENFQHGQRMIKAADAGPAPCKKAKSAPGCGVLGAGGARNSGAHRVQVSLATLDADIEPDGCLLEEKLRLIQLAGI